jgi:HK97 family phage prohead protease
VSATIRGYALLWSDRATIDGASERFAPYAFNEPCSARLVVSHDHRPGAFLASTGGTLRVGQDDVGLRFSAQLLDDRDGRRALAAIRYGTLQSCSFGFRSISEREDEDGGVVVEQAVLKEISLTSAPAYALSAAWAADAEDLPPRFEALRKAWHARATAGRPERVERELAAFTRTRTKALAEVAPAAPAPPVRDDDPIRKAVRARLMKSAGRYRAWA